MSFSSEFTRGKTSTDGNLMRLLSMFERLQVLLVLLLFMAQFDVIRLKFENVLYFILLFLFFLPTFWTIIIFTISDCFLSYVPET